MSAMHPRPWKAVHETSVRERRRDGKRGSWNTEYWAVLDARGVFVAQGLDKDTAQEIAEVRDIDEFPLRFTLELRYDDARKCLEDALLVAREREFCGVAHLIDIALSSLLLIGKLTGINGQKRIEGGTPCVG